MIPGVLDQGTQVLNFNSNNLQILSENMFSEAGLLNLQKVYLSQCQIRQIDTKAFAGLINLVTLDLSHNEMTTIPSHAFHSISELQELNLAGNQIQQILSNAFMSVPNLNTIILSENKINSIDNKAFKQLSNLKLLKLDSNQIALLRSRVVFPLRSLEGLELDQNPWICDCNLRPLIQWMKRYKVPYWKSPICQKPPRLKNKSWDKMNDDEFACPPNVQALDSRISAEEETNSTLICIAHGIPEPDIIWEWKGQPLHNSSQHRFYINEIRKEGKYSHLTIVNVTKRLQGEYTCKVHNKAGHARDHLSLFVSRKRPPNPLLGRRPIGVQLFIIVFTVLLAIVIFLLAACIVCIRKKRRTRYGSVRENDENDINNKSAKISSLSAKNLGNRKSVGNNVAKYRVLNSDDEKQTNKNEQVENWLLRQNDVLDTDDETQNDRTETVESKDTETLIQSSDSTKDESIPLEDLGDTVLTEATKHVVAADVNSETVFKETPLIFNLCSEKKPNHIQQLVDTSETDMPTKSSINNTNDALSFSGVPHSQSFVGNKPCLFSSDVPQSIDDAHSPTMSVHSLPNNKQDLKLPIKPPVYTSLLHKINEKSHYNSPHDDIRENHQAAFCTMPRKPRRVVPPIPEPGFVSRGKMQFARKLPQRPDQAHYSSSINLSDLGNHIPRRIPDRPSLPSSPVSETHSTCPQDLLRADGAKSVCSRSDKMNYERHAKELQTFLSEYKRLQDQLQTIKRSYARTRRMSIGSPPNIVSSSFENPINSPNNEPSRFPDPHHSRHPPIMGSPNLQEERESIIFGESSMPENPDYKNFHS